MVIYENECVGCATETYPCNPYCSRKRVPHYFCDRCGIEGAEDDFKYTKRQCYCDLCFDELFG